MTDYFRALCQELMEELENAIRVIHHEDGTKHISAAYPVLNKTKAALAQPEPQGPTDEDIEDLMWEHTSEIGGQVFGGGIGVTPKDALALVRAVLDRWGQDQQNKEAIND